MNDLIKQDDIIDDLLPIADIPTLTEAEITEASRFQNAINILGPAAGAALVCPGNQESLSDEDKCPYSAKCVMLKAKKAPKGQLCPIEAQQITELFKNWAAELEKAPMELTASERVFLSEIVFLGIQEQRCASIISKGKAAQLVQINPKEVHPETLDPLTWEKVIHANVLRLDQISLNRSRLLKEWMLTPEQKAKQARWDGKTKNTDESSKQSLIADKIRQIQKSKRQLSSEDPQTTDPEP
jgi:hypothetical protein